MQKFLKTFSEIVSVDEKSVGKCMTAKCITGIAMNTRRINQKSSNLKKCSWGQQQVNATNQLPIDKSAVKQNQMYTDYGPNYAQHPRPPGFSL